MTAAAAQATVARFKASRAHACASTFECAGIEVGDRAGYVPTGNGVPLVVCAACLDRVEASDQLEAVDEPQPESTDAQEHDSTSAPEHDSTNAPEHVCTCARITKRAKFTTRPDGVVIHGNCGLPAPAKYQNPTEPAPTSLGDWCNCHGGPQPWHLIGEVTCKYEPSQNPTEEPPRDQPGPDPANPDHRADSAAGGDAAAGDEVRPTGEPLGAPEAGARRPDGPGRGAVEGDQDGGDAGGAGGDAGGDPAAPVAAVPVPGVPAEGDAARLEEAQGEGPGDLRPVHDPAHDVADGPDPVTEPEGPSLAAFFSQPADEDEPETTLAAFYAQPSEEDDELAAAADAEPFPGGGEGVTPATLIGEEEPLHVQADRAQAEHHDALVHDALADLGAQCGGTVTALIVAIDGEDQPRVFEVPL